MANVGAPADQATDLLQKLSLDAQPKPLEIPEPTKKTSSNQYGSVDAGNAANGQVQPNDRAMTPVLPDFMDPTMCYVPNGYPSTAYYYGGYDATGNNWEDYSRYANAEGVDLTSGVYGEDGSLIYHPGYGYAPYGPYSPAVNSNSGVTTNGAVKGTAGSAPVKSAHQSSFNSNGSFGRGAFPGYQDPRFGFDGMRSPIPWLDGSVFSDGQPRPVTSGAMNNTISNANSAPSSRNQQFRPNSHFMGLHHPRPISGIGTANAFMNRMYPNKLYGQYGSAVRSGMGFGAAGRNWLAFDNKYKNKGRGNGYYGYGNDSADGLNELNRGPRAKNTKNQRGVTPVAVAVKGQTLPANGTTEEENEMKSLAPDREQYNKSDFPEEYADAKFFIIKSYSEDDVHKSIKYNVWASTPNGNKKLDAAYKESQEKDGGCPIFLFFSVNTSGQFVGVAEMVGPVDFNKNVEYWQQDKWYGCFPVKWHIVKDVPNSSLKHIILENNENKPVTNSRDTQEVKLEQGLKMIKIFKEHSSKTCLLDDFEFYENRQKAIQEKKAKQQQVQKQVWEGKLHGEKDVVNGELKLQKSPEVASVLVKETAPAAQANGDVKQPEDGKVLIAVANGVANGC
ncbi:YTH domain-containing protein ECT2 isoform X3 [Punica granatum]|uniref:YTH domain-containing family protein n=1 Tax=Punica granatum TaxID=22663 RepID=A0A6P8DPR5_PUNGR|nr:YTH domain-containing protein ECT2 isoform X3 [Punica granatum]